MTNVRETTIGAVVLLILTALFMLEAADMGGTPRNSKRYVLLATFSQTNGLSPGSDVRMAGMPVGSVQSQSLAPDYRVRTVLSLTSDVRVPADSAAVIETMGFLGPKYVEIRPGGAEESLAPGSSFEYTQGSLALEDLLERLLDASQTTRNDAKAAPSSSLRPPADNSLIDVPEPD